MTSSEVVFILANGFGFDNEFWKLCQFFLKQNHKFLSDININTYKFEKNKKFIGIGHSLGFIKLLRSGINFSQIIGLNAFSNFLGNCAKIREKRSAELNTFEKMFRLNPRKTLLGFYKKCGCNYSPAINLVEAAKDFDLLRAEIIFSENIPITILASTNDPVVPQEIITDNFSSKLNVNTVFLNSNKHIPPFIDVVNFVTQLL